MGKTIIRYYKAKPEGVVLETNIPSKLKTGNVKGTTFFVSWDRIGELLFDNYTDVETVRELNEIRNIPK